MCRAGSGSCRGSRMLMYAGRWRRWDPGFSLLVWLAGVAGHLIKLEEIRDVRSHRAGLNRAYHVLNNPCKIGKEVEIICV